MKNKEALTNSRTPFDMPLNKSQRDEIEKSIAHLFYGLSTDNAEFTKEITAVGKAIEQTLPPLPREQKEAEEKHADDENIFTELSKIITDSESLIKGLENRNKHITVNEVTEYIIFYVICRMQYHLQHLEADDDDFNLSTWLLNSGASEAELISADETNAPIAWQLQDLLTKTRAANNLATRGWNTEATRQRLTLQKDRPFKTFIPNVDYGSYNFNWELPELRDRMYRAEIKERWIESKNSNDYPLPPIPSIDLHITTPFAKDPEIIKFFHAYPRILPLKTATRKAINERIDEQVFETKEAREKARKIAISRAEDAEAVEQEEKIKAIAIARAEKEATRLLVKHLEKMNSMATHSPAQLRVDEPVVNELDASDIEGHDHIPESHSPQLPPPVQATIINASMPAAIQAIVVNAPISVSTIVRTAVNEPADGFDAPDMDGNAAMPQAAHNAIEISALERRDFQQFLDAVDEVIGEDIMEFDSNVEASRLPIAPSPQSANPTGNNIHIVIDMHRASSEEDLQLPPLEFDEGEYPAASPMEQNRQSPARYQGQSTPPLSPFQGQFSPIAAEDKHEHSHLSISHLDLAADEQLASPSHYYESEDENHAAEMQASADADEQPLLAANQSSNVAFADSADSPEVKPFSRPRASTPHHMSRSVTPPAQDIIRENAPTPPYSPDVEMGLPPAFANDVDRMLQEIDALVGNSSAPNVSSAQPSQLALPPALPNQSLAASNRLPDAPPRLFSRHNLQSPRRTHPRSNAFLAPPRTAKKPRPAPIQQDRVNLYAPGMVLVTYKYYYDEVSTERMSLFGLEVFSYQETRNLSSLAVTSLLKNGLMEMSTALALQPGILKLIETPYYFKYFQLHPEAIALMMHVTLDFAKSIATPFITNLLERGAITLEADLLTLTLDELSIINNAMYGEYFCHHSQALALIKGVTPEECRILFNPTVRGLVDKRILAIDVARGLIKRLQPFQLEVLLDETCAELFLKGKLTTVDNITPQNAMNLRDKKISALIESDVLTADVGMNLTAEEKAVYSLPPVHALLLTKKITPEQVKNLKPIITLLVTSEPYASALASNPECLLMFLQWPDDELLQLFVPAISSLFQNGVINFESFRTREINFFAILKGNNISQLLIEKKITLAQALWLTPATWNAIESYQHVFNVIRANTDNQQQLEYLSFTVWSTLLTNRLVAFYRGMPEQHGNMADTVDIISGQMDAVAAGEQISKEALQQRCVGFFLTFLYNELNSDLQNIPIERIPPTYHNIRNEINRTSTNPSPDWLATLDTIAQEARIGFRDISRRRFIPNTVNIIDRPVLHQCWLEAFL
jgi:hypothetical protein